MIQSSLSNFSILLLMHLAMTIIIQYKRKMATFSYYFYTVTLVTLSVTAMFYLPIEFEGFFFDMRFIPLVFFAYFHGWRIGIPALILASLWRYLMGGVGMAPGIIFGMIGPTLLALLLHYIPIRKYPYGEKIGLIFASWLISDIPIIFLVPNGSQLFADIALFRLSSFLITSIVLYTLIIQNRRYHSLYMQLERLASEDSLTQLYNKRNFFKVVDEKLRIDSPNYYIAMIDIDYFKSINDTYGHIVGDTVLKEFANLLKKHASQHVKVGRYGGEEFIMYIGNSSNEEATRIVNSFIKDVESYHFSVDQLSIKITCSVGLAQLTNKKSIFSAVQQADQHLYVAKKRGRNCLVCSI